MKLTGEQRRKYKAEILNWIEDENNLEATPLEKIEYFFKCYESEAVHNTTYYGSFQEGVKQWLQGLPSCIPLMPYTNYEILQLAHKFGGIEANPTDKQEQKILDNYFHFISAYLMHMKTMSAKQLEKLSK